MSSSEHRFGIVARLGDFLPLLPAEQEVVDGLSSGDFETLGDGLIPQSRSEERVIRAHFLRFLLLGGDDDCRPHEKGIRLRGAWISGVLDLEACRILRDCGLNDCHFDTAPILNSAVIERLFLNNSWFPGLHAERLQARGGLYIRNAVVDSEIRLINATLGGNVVCDGASFRAESGPAFNAEGIEARRLSFRGTSCIGAMILIGSDLGADLDCADFTVTAAGEVAVDARGAEIGGSVVLRGARVIGEVRFLAAKIGGDLDCTSVVITNPESSWPPTHPINHRGRIHAARLSVN